MKSGYLKNKEKANKIEPLVAFENLKNDYFLQLLFSNLKRERTLNIVKYNKNIKKRINININDYKEYSEIYSLIEIEIKTANNSYGKFINICNRDEKYYHIFFNNNNKEEIKKNYFNKDEHIKNIKIIIDYQIKSFEKLFMICDIIESIKFKKLYRNDINNMSYMFSGCKSIKELNLKNLNTNNINNMSHMFDGCSS